MPTKKKTQSSFSDATPWIALAIVSLISMASTVMLTSAFSKEINGYINQPARLLVHEKTGHAWVEIDFNGKGKRLFESDLGSYTYTLPEVLAEIAKTAHFSLRIRQGKIQELAGISAGIGSWNIYRYDTQKSQPIDRLAISGNDYYRIKFE